MWILIWVALVVVGGLCAALCSETLGGHQPAGEDTGSAGDVLDGPCGVSVVGTVPADEETAAPADTWPTFLLSAPDPSAQIEGLYGEVHVSDGGRTVALEPSSPLEPGEAYTVSLAWCGGESSLSFRVAPGDTASDDTASDDTASDDTASDDTASDDTASDDTASDDTG